MTQILSEICTLEQLQQCSLMSGMGGCQCVFTNKSYCIQYIVFLIVITGKLFYSHTPSEPPFLRTFPTVVFCWLPFWPAAVWPKSPASGTAQEGSMTVFFFAAAYFNACIFWHVQPRQHILDRSNWMTGSLLSCVISVVQTLNTMKWFTQTPADASAVCWSPATWPRSDS